MSTISKITEQEKKELIEIINLGIRGDVRGGLAAGFQLLGRCVHEGAMTKDDVWDILVGTFHTDEEYDHMQENPDPMAMLAALLM